MVNGTKQWVFHELGWFIGGKIRKQPPILREVGGKNHSRLVVYDCVKPKAWGSCKLPTMVISGRTDLCNPSWTVATVSFTGLGV